MRSCEEFSNQFDVLFNNITSNQAPGLNEFEKSSFLTKAQNELVKNYFEASSKGNAVGKGFDDSAIRQMDFSTLMCSESLSPTEDSPVVNPKALVYKLPSKALVIVNEEIVLNTVTPVYTTVYHRYTNGGWVTMASTDAPVLVNGSVDSEDELPESPTEGSTYAVKTHYSDTKEPVEERMVIPLSFAEYTRLMSKPFKEPLKRQAWRLMSNGSSAEGISSSNVEIVLTSVDIDTYSKEGIDYVLRYVRKPKPIILEDLKDYGDNIKIEGENTKTMCELDESTHDAILQRAVELAKTAWELDANQQQMHLASGQRSE